MTFKPGDHAWHYTAKGKASPEGMLVPCTVLRVAKKRVWVIKHFADGTHVEASVPPARLIREGEWDE